MSGHKSTKACQNLQYSSSVECQPICCRVASTGAIRKLKKLLQLLTTILMPLVITNEAKAQSVQDLMNKAVNNPQVRNAMRDRNISIPWAGNRRVMEAQRLLNAQGFDAGTPDGIVGRGTRRAIAAFQGSIRRPTTGTLSEEEFAMLQSGESAAPSNQAHVSIRGYSP